MGHDPKCSSRAHRVRFTPDCRPIAASQRTAASGQEETHAPQQKPGRFNGRIACGFDLVGYHFSPAGLTVAAKTIANFVEKASRLYEQERSAVLAATALEMYVRRWVRWTTSALNVRVWLGQ